MKQCAEYHDTHVRALASRRLLIDEIWTFNYCKKRNVTPGIAAKHPDAGHVWLWVGIDADSKLVASWRVGRRDLGTAYDFMHDLADRLTQRVQLTSDAFRVYLEAVESAFNLDIDYAMLQKIYGANPNPEKRYSLAKILSSTTEVIQGNPDPKHISTSYVERLNWSLRTSNRRYTRLSNGFSRKLRNHEASTAASKRASTTADGSCARASPQSRPLMARLGDL